LQIANFCPATLALQARVTDGDSRAGDANRAVDDNFKTAEMLLRLILHDLAATLHARLTETELRVTRRRLGRLEAEAANSRLPEKASEPGTGAPTPVPVGHARQIVDIMLDYMHQHYQRPMALRDVATILRMNASYLSSLFSRTMGVTFHHYLDELRLARAEELLRDPRARVCEVACAVGYASPNHFRIVFKTHEGVSPSAWRELPQPTDREASH
jgi:transcriptional regulator GlxA family with amidase domain